MSRQVLQAAVLMLLGVGCSSFACDERDDPNHGTCTAYASVRSDRADYREQCDGEWRVGDCPTADRIGGCANNGFAGFDTTWVSWHYEGSAGGFDTEADVAAACGDDFVES